MAAELGTHPSANALFAFATCTLDDVQAAGMMKHLDICPDCCRVITTLVGDGFLARVRQERIANSTPAPAESPAGTALAPTSEASPIGNLPAEISRVKITCPSCSVTDTVPASFSGKEVACRKCRAKFTVDSQKTVLGKSEPTHVAKPEHAENPPHVDDTDRVSAAGPVLDADGASDTDRASDTDHVSDANHASDTDRDSDANGVSDADRTSDRASADRSNGKRTGQRTAKRTGKRDRLPDRRPFSRWLVLGSFAATILIGVGLVIFFSGALGSRPPSEAKAELEAKVKLPPPSIPSAGAKDQTKQSGKRIDKGAAPATQPDDKPVFLLRRSTKAHRSSSRTISLVLLLLRATRARRISSRTMTSLFRRRRSH